MKFILTADWHLRETTPAAWVGDDFQKTQWERVETVYRIARENNAHILHAGDLFHSWKCGYHLPYRLNQTATEKMMFIPGNHELPQHNRDEWMRSPCSVLDDVYFENLALAGPKNTWISGKWYGDTDSFCQSQILLLHEMIWQSAPYPGAPPEGNVIRVMNRFKGQKCKLIVCGDNHIPFHVFRQGIHLVNCGPIIRQTASEIDIKPSVWLYDDKDHTVEKIELDFCHEDISREHISKREQVDERLMAFVESLQGIEASLDFEKNLEIAMEKASMNEGDRKLIRQYVEESQHSR